MATLEVSAGAYDPGALGPLLGTFPNDFLVLRLHDRCRWRTDQRTHSQWTSKHTTYLEGEFISMFLHVCMVVSGAAASLHGMCLNDWLGGKQPCPGSLVITHTEIGKGCRLYTEDFNHLI